MLRRVAALFYEPYGTSNLIRPAPAFSALFGTGSKRQGFCDLSMLGTGDVGFGKQDGQNELSNTVADTWYGRCLLLFTVRLHGREVNGVYVRWFGPSKYGWNSSLNLRPLEWYK
jgi:hypothetical protein